MIELKQGKVVGLQSTFPIPELAPVMTTTLPLTCLVGLMENQTRRQIASTGANHRRLRIPRGNKTRSKST
jgi:hypothetical protein